jgi:signal transduction histidine kinase/CheY-like chemotaxis protein
MEKYSKQICVIVGAFSIFLGAIVLFGWYSHNLSLIQVSTAFVPMQYNTALFFIICGAGLIAACFSYTRTAMACGTLALFIGVFTLVEYIFSLDLLIDQFFMKAYVTTKTSHPGRMAPNTALCFTLSGITLLVSTLKNIPRRPLLVSIFGALTLILGLIAFIGYFIHIEDIYGWGSLTRMAIHTSVGFIALGIGFITYSIKFERQQNQMDKDVAKFTIPVKKYLSLLIVNSIIFALISYGIFRLNEDFKSNRGYIKEATELIGKIEYLDEVLTSSASMAAETGLPGWEQRYNDNVTKLGVAIERVNEIAPSRLAEDLNQNTRVANDILVALETEVFKNIAIGNQLEAQNILKSNRYLSNKQKYSRGVENFIYGMHEFISDSEYKFKVVSSRIIFLSLFGLLILIVGWGYLITTQLRVSRDNKRLYENMESEIRQRTSELQQRQYVEESIECMDQGYLMIDEDLNILTYNTRYPEILNMPASIIEQHPNYEDVLRYFGEHVMHFSSEKIEELIELATKKEKFFNTIEFPNGKIVEVRHIPKDSGGYVRIFTDITYRESITRELESQKSIIEKTMNNIEQGVVMYDENLKLLAINNKYSDIIGIPAEFIEHATSYDEIIRYTSEVLLNESERSEKVIEQAKSRQPFTYLIFYPDGKIVEIQHFPIQEGGAVRTFADVTNREKAEKEMHDAKEAAEKANIAKSTFLANMSHELRTPLNAVLGFSELMARDTQSTPGQKENLNVINRSGQHLLALINNVLDMSKIEAGRTELEAAPLDLHRLLQEIGDMFRLRAEAKDLAFTLELRPGLPQYFLLDMGKLRQVFINLLGNAVTFTEVGGVAMRADAEALPDGNWQLRFEVADTGTGIPADEIETIFDAFAQAGHALAKQQGTGLGLAISHQFIQLMGGNITVESTPDEGSIFRFEIPAESADAADVLHPPEETRQRVVGLAKGEPEWRILIVEDEANNRLLLHRLLASVGFRVREAVNGEEGLQQFKDWEPHLIWMDMRMPVMDGYEATRRIRELSGCKEVKILALTASAFKEQEEQCLAAGCDAVLHKPYREQALFAAMGEQLNLHYVYEEDSELQSQRALPKLYAKDLLHLPAEWRDEFLTAAQLGDIDALLSLTKALPATESESKAKLDSYINEFQLETLIKVFEQSTDKTV